MATSSIFAKRAGENPMNAAFNTAMSGGMVWLDMVMKLQREMQRASFQSLSSYSPISDTRITGEMPQQSDSVQVIPVGEERLNVATSTVQGETTRIRRRVVSQPVEQQIVLRDEKVVVERRSPPGSELEPDVLTATVIEMTDSRQVPHVWKSLHVAEEVVLRKQVTERTENVRETVRRDVVDVEHARAAVTGPMREVGGNVALLPPRQEPDREPQNRAKPQPSSDKRQTDEQQGHKAQPSDDKRHDEKPQHDEKHEKAPGAAPTGAAAQSSPRKS